MKRLLFSLLLVASPRPALAGAMTAEEKIGQVMMGCFDGPVLSEALAERIKALHFGGVILYSKSGNIQNPEQVASLVSSIQAAARASKNPPLFVAIDQEGGNVVRLTDGVTVFGSQMSVGATRDPRLASGMARVMAKELRTLGINFNFAPVADVNSNPNNPVIGTRSFGSDPTLVSRLGSAMVEAYEEEKVVCSAKHFPGHGDTSVDSHFGLPRVEADRPHLERVEWPPFKEMIRAGVPAIMTAHVLIPALSKAPGTLSPEILGALRKDLGFGGLVVTDSMTMGAIAKHYGLAEASIRALNAGADLLLFGADADHTAAEQNGVYAALVQAVKTGRIPMSRLDEAVERNLAIKARYGILENPLPTADGKTADSRDHRAVAEQIAEESLTLLRDEEKLLPLKGKIPILWPENQSESLNALMRQCPFLEGRLVPASLSPAAARSLADSIPGPVLVGSYDLAKNPRWRALLEALRGKQVLVLAMRSPYDLLHCPWVGGYLATYGDRPVSLQALGKLLRGELPPRGRLPIDLPGLYPIGSGLMQFSR